jgi:hypothetical protein
MYHFLLNRFGERAAHWGTVGWYAVLLALVAFSFTTPGTEFRYGNL